MSHAVAPPRWTAMHHGPNPARRAHDHGVHQMRFPRALAFAVVLALASAGLAAEPALFPITVNDKHGMIDRAGTVVIPPEYAEPVVFRDGLARVAKGSKVAYVDAVGAFVIAPQDAAREPFSEGLAPARGRDA